MKQKYWVLLSLAVCCAAQAPACSARFIACQESRSCARADTSGDGGAAGEGNAGAGGEAGEPAAGAAGDLPSVACAHDSDCINPDAAHCVVSCAEKDGTSACVVQGADADKDGFLSASCAAAPGEDCNDSNGAIHPGATEICDRIDNDCNGKVDVGDSVAVSGANLTLDHSRQIASHIVALPERLGYGIGLRDKITRLLSIETVDGKGKLVVSPVTITAAGEIVDDFSLTAGAGLIGVAWVNSVVKFSFMSSDGAVVGTAAEMAHLASKNGAVLASPSVVRTTAEPWVVMYGAGAVEDRALIARAFSDPAAVDPSTNGLLFGVTHASTLNTAAVGDHVAAVYVDGTTSHASGILADVSNVSASVSLTLSGNLPVVASRPGGFAVAVSGASPVDTPQFYAFSAAGVPQCGPVALGGRTETPTSVVGSAYGYLAVLVGAKGVVVQEVLADCTLGARFAVDPTPTGSEAFIAGSSLGFGMVWTGSDGLNFRAFGPNFCD